MRPDKYTQEQLDAQIARQLQRELELEDASRAQRIGRNDNNNNAPQGRQERLQREERDRAQAIALQKQLDEQMAREVYQRETNDRVRRKERDRAQALVRQRELDEQFAREMYQREVEQENKSKKEAQLLERLDRLKLERTQAQIEADGRLARQLQDEASQALARQLEQEAEQDYAAFEQYSSFADPGLPAWPAMADKQYQPEEDSSSDEYDEQAAQDQLDQRRRELEQRRQQELQNRPRPVVPVVPDPRNQQRPIAPIAPRVPTNGRRLVAPCIFDHDDLLQLSGLTGGALRIEGVYHVYSRAEVPEDQDWSCGFHAVYNMVKLERRACNRRIGDREFINACRAIAPHNLHGHSDMTQGLAIARRIGIPHSHCLIRDHGAIQVLFERGVEYELHSDDDEDEVAARASAQQDRKFWQDLRRVFAQSRNSMCIHFDCHIMSHSIQEPGHAEDHAVLVTVVKMGNGATAIYIFDNVNEDENHVSQAQMRAYVEHIYRQLLG